jgi:hypothetical protein
MKKQYIILAVAIVLLVVSITFLPILGEILFIPFIFIFQYTCRSSNQQRQEQAQQQLEQNPQNNPEILVPIQKRNESNPHEKICEICGAKISQPNIRFCESCGAKLN